MLEFSLGVAIEVVVGVSNGIKSAGVRICWSCDYKHVFSFFPFGFVHFIYFARL